MIEQDNKILVIAGMHRSGTSVISQWLDKCGLHLGETLLGAATGNIEGHFEDTDFLRVHEQTLQAHGFPGSGITAEAIPELSVYEKEKLKALVGFKNRLDEQWGWKEPRTCLFLDHYRELIPNAYYVFVIRDYHETVSSLIQRELKELDLYYSRKSWISRQNWKIRQRNIREEKLYKEYSAHYLEVWINYNEYILKSINSLPNEQFIVTDHHLLQNNYHDVFAQLVYQWGFPLTCANFNEVYKPSLQSKVISIDEYIETQLLDKARKLEEAIRSRMTKIPQNLHHFPAS